MNLDLVMAQLAKRRRAFHSEADFQHELAWEIHAGLPDSDIRLEVPVVIGAHTLHVDVLVRVGNERYAIELKYRTTKVSLEADGEHFSLRNHSANDTGRYDFLKDVSRLESLYSAGRCSKGFALQLTNDDTYWRPQSKTSANDSDFRLQEGRIIYGTLEWRGAPSPGSIKGREAALELRGKYVASWKPFSVVGDGRGKSFQYLSLEVGN